MPTKRDDAGTWTFVCGRPYGCGSPEEAFTSSGWPTKADAVARGEQHEREHADGTPTPELAEFRAERGVKL